MLLFRPFLSKFLNIWAILILFEIISDFFTLKRFLNNWILAVCGCAACPKPIFLTISRNFLQKLRKWDKSLKVIRKNFPEFGAQMSGIVESDTPPNERLTNVNYIWRNKFKIFAFWAFETTNKLNFCCMSKFCYSAGAYKMKHISRIWTTIFHHIGRGPWLIYQRVSVIDFKF